MRKLYQQIKARTDIKKIWLYSYKNFGLQQAEKYYDELIIGKKTIEENPEIGILCDYIRSGYRQYKINEYFVFLLLKQK